MDGNFRSVLVTQLLSNVSRNIFTRDTYIAVLPKKQLKSFRLNNALLFYVIVDGDCVNIRLSSYWA